MSKRDQLKVFIELSVDHEKGEAPKWKPANTPGGTNPWNDTPCRRMIRNELKDALNLIP
jgi:hypothetical protein